LQSFVFRSKDKVRVWIAMNGESREGVKKRGERLILSVGIIPYGNIWHASYCLLDITSKITTTKIFTVNRR